jgi:hypothetical protein
MRKLTRTGLLVTAWGAWLVGAACTGDDPNLTSGGTTEPDAAIDGVAPLDGAQNPADAADAAVRTKCDPDQQFDPPVIIGSLSSDSQDYGLRLSDDEKRAFFTSNRVHARDAGDGGDGGAFTDFEVYTTSRPTNVGAFAMPTAVAELNIDVSETTVGLSPDGLLAIVARSAPGGGTNMWMATRPGAIGGFSTPTLLSMTPDGGTLDVPAKDDGDAYITATDLWFYSNRSGAGDIYRAPRTGPTTFGAPVELADINTPTFQEGSPVVSEDGLVLYFASNRTDGAQAKGLRDVWVSTRATTKDPFGLPRNVGELNTPTDESPNWLSADGCRLYIGRANGPSTDFLIAVRRP